MPAKTSKRKSEGGDVRSSADAKKAKKDENMKLFEKMKKEADENKKRAAEKKLKEKKKDSRRTTIAATSSSRTQNVVEKPSRKSIGVSKKPKTERKTTPSLPPVPSPRVEDINDDQSDSSSGEDEFDRLVSRDSSRRNSGRMEVPYEDEYAKVYTRRPNSKRQRDFLKRQKEMFDRSKRGYHSSDDSESEDEASQEQEKEKVVQVKPKKKSTPLKAKELATPSTQAVTGQKDEMMMQIDTILFSIVCFFLGALLVVGVFYTLTSLDLTSLFTSLLGTTFTGLSGHIQEMTQRVTMLIIALSMIFGGMEIFMWFNRRANSRKQVVAQLAEEAKSLIKAKKFYPSDFVMEEVLDQCSQLRLNDCKIDRSVIKSLWADVVAVLLEDARMLSADHIFEGKKRRCLRFVGGTAMSPSSSTSSSSSSTSLPLPATKANPTGQINMF